ncbi:nuclear transport factor 2 family protein [Pseudonocardia sp. WMMC193]|uniref:nuclear transport factor 2 family protein n=1 Tax=Pseudonocardia sp. WMMC193 TaxID=2911965 RepID=UPI001F1C1132|nr:nuclear transport factor 2 family protein [Pseudonocardia sp. WMMC193]MCF7548590.1 nuclear transport factor 2 family protein [Pseudonocardia sp. WMMC193]
MAPVHPTDRTFPAAYSLAWTSDPAGLLEFFAPEGTYTDVALGATYTGRAQVGRFHRFMVAFAPDSEIVFTETSAGAGRLTSEWVWSGSCTGPLRLRDGSLVDAGGARFSVPGVAVCTYDESGLLTSHRDYWDLTTVLLQAGVPIGSPVEAP